MCFQIDPQTFFNKFCGLNINSNTLTNIFILFKYPGYYSFNLEAYSHIAYYITISGHLIQKEK